MCLFAFPGMHERFLLCPSNFFALGMASFPRHRHFKIVKQLSLSCQIPNIYKPSSILWYRACGLSLIIDAIYDRRMLDHSSIENKSVFDVNPMIVGGGCAAFFKFIIK